MDLADWQSTSVPRAGQQTMSVGRLLCFEVSRLESLGFPKEVLLSAGFSKFRSEQELPTLTTIASAIALVQHAQPHGQCPPFQSPPKPCFMVPVLGLATLAHRPV